MVAVRGHGGAGDRVKEGYFWRGRPLGVSPRHGGERRHSAWRKEEEGGGGLAGWAARGRVGRLANGSSGPKMRLQIFLEFS
jgi:hypothetical protein